MQHSFGKRLVSRPALLLFSGGEPEHHCVVPSGQTLNATIPLELRDKKWRYSQCRRYVNLSVGNETTPCDDGWYYDDTEFHSSIVSDVSSYYHLIVPGQLT